MQPQWYKPAGMLGTGRTQPAGRTAQPGFTPNHENKALGFFMLISNYVYVGEGCTNEYSCPRVQKRV